MSEVSPSLSQALTLIRLVSNLAYTKIGALSATSEILEVLYPTRQSNIYY
jgi:hypothetical protein